MRACFLDRVGRLYWRLLVLCFACFSVFFFFCWLLLADLTVLLTRFIARIVVRVVLCSRTTSSWPRLSTPASLACRASTSPLTRERASASWRSSSPSSRYAMSYVVRSLLSYLTFFRVNSSIRDPKRDVHMYRGTRSSSLASFRVFSTPPPSRNPTVGCVRHVRV